jgi:hypothetical protein
VLHIHRSRRGEGATYSLRSPDLECRARPPCDSDRSELRVVVLGLGEVVTAEARLDLRTLPYRLVRRLAVLAEVRSGLAAATAMAWS